jgi:hypothetical protein
MKNICSGVNGYNKSPWLFTIFGLVMLMLYSVYTGLIPCIGHDDMMMPNSLVRVTFDGVMPLFYVFLQQTLELSSLNDNMVVMMSNSLDQGHTSCTYAPFLYFIIPPLRRREGYTVLP